MDTMVEVKEAPEDAVHIPKRVVADGEEIKFSLRAVDLADCCEAQACYRVMSLSNKTLFFCMHHFKKNERKLTEFAKEILDESARLTFKRHVGTEHS